jgi:hypothetical protein
LPDTDVIADCGRLEPGAPSATIARHAQLVVVAARPTLEGVAHLRARLAAPAGPAPVGVVLIGERPYSAAEVEATVGVKVIGVLPQDERAAAMLNGEPGTASKLHRSSLVRSARDLAAAIAGVTRADRPTSPTVVEPVSPSERNRALVNGGVR